jgi:hypothetical protein
MRCPEEIANILHEILTQSLLRIRAAGWANNAALCATEADHVHNIPVLLAHYSAEYLKSYIEVVTSSSYVDRCHQMGYNIQQYRALWDKLEQAYTREIKLARI